MADPVLDELIGLSAEAEEAHEEYMDLKEKGKAAKDRWEALTLRIQSKLKGLRESHPLFDEKDDDDRDDDSGGGGGGDDGPSGPISPVNPGDGDVIDAEFSVSRPALPAPAFLQPVASVHSEAWRSDPMEMLVDFGLTDKTLGLLDEAAIRTIGALADWSNSGKRLIDIDGIGEARATEIEEAMDGYWSAWSQEQDGTEAEKPRRKKRTA